MPAEVLSWPLTNDAGQSLNKTFTLPLNNLTAIVDPTVSDGEFGGYTYGSRWVNRTDDREFVLVDPTPNAAVWKCVTDPDTKDVSRVHIVRCATATAGALATAYAAGQTVDGVTLATGDRILIKNAPTSIVTSWVGPQSPTSGTDDSSVGTVAWTNPGNILAADASAATATTAGVIQTHYLVATGFDFSSIPGGATIVGIVIEWLRKSGSSSTTDTRRIRVIKGGAIGATELSSNPTWTTTYTYETVGGASSLCGETWTVGDIQASNFGSALQAGINNDTASVDHCRITVYYTESTGVAANAGIYVARSTGTPARARDADTGDKLVGALVMVKSGSTNDKTLWMNDQESITLGTTSVTFTQVSP